MVLCCDPLAIALTPQLWRVRSTFDSCRADAIENHSS
jgi:hypothetical protein